MDLSVLGVPIRNVTQREAVALVEPSLRRRPSPAKSVFFVNAHTLNLAAADPTFRRTLGDADFVFADGTGVRWAARLHGVRLKQNMVGTDFVPTLFHETAGRGYSYFLLGADATTIERAADHARKTFDGWTLAGFHHGYLNDEASLAEAIERINAARPDVLLVGMGNPLQERWIERHRAKLDASLCFGVGGLFDHWAKNICRAPRWLRWLGHEWFWLLCQQPRQKAKRYLVGNPLFLIRAASERLGLRDFSPPSRAPSERNAGRE
ncbi:MAG: WecB/TagA/CpsF family glycosyltransferase [Thermoguttaceae bacterium]